MLRPFVAQLRLYTSTLPDDQTRLRTAVSFLRGLAFDQVHPYIRDIHVDLANLPALITILETAFGNPNRVREAESKLNNIQQGTRDFATYHAEFQRYAGEVSWNEASKLAALHRGLSNRLAQDLIAVSDEPGSLVEWVALCQRLDNRRRMFQQRFGSPVTPRSTVSTSKPTATYATPA